MPTYAKFMTEDGAIIWVEVEAEEAPQEGVVKAGLGEMAADAVGQVQNRFETALETIHHSAEAIIGKIRTLGDRPDEVEVTFGLKATGEAGGTFVVAKAGVEANYTIKLVWKRPSEPSAPPRRGRRRVFGR